MTESEIVKKNHQGEVQYRLPIESIKTITVSKRFNLFGLCSNFIWIGIISSSVLCAFLAFLVFSSAFLTWALAIIAAVLLWFGIWLLFEPCLTVFFKEDFPNSRTKILFAPGEFGPGSEMWAFIKYIRDRLWGDVGDEVAANGEGEVSDRNG